MKPIIGIAGNQLIRATDTFQGNQGAIHRKDSWMQF